MSRYLKCAVILDELRSIPYCVIKSKKIHSDAFLEEYARIWMYEHNDNCPWSNYRCVIMDVNKAPKIKRVEFV